MAVVRTNCQALKLQNWEGADSRATMLSLSDATHALPVSRLCTTHTRYFAHAPHCKVVLSQGCPAWSSSGSCPHRYTVANLLRAVKGQPCPHWAYSYGPLSPLYRCDKSPASATRWFRVRLGSGRCNRVVAASGEQRFETSGSTQ